MLRLRWYGAMRGLDFRLLNRHPVMTSARTRGGMITLLVSYLVALVLIPINTVLPKRLRIRGRWKVLGFWYGHRQ